MTALETIRSSIVTRMQAAHANRNEAEREIARLRRKIHAAAKREHADNYRSQMSCRHADIHEANGAIAAYEECLKALG